MKLSAAIALILVQLGTGVLLTMPLIPVSEVRRSYFTFHTMMAAVCFALAAGVEFSVFGNFVLGLVLLLAMTLCVVAFAMVKAENFGLLRAVYLISAGVGAFVIVGSKPDWKGFTWDSDWIGLSFLMGALLLGVAHNAMALGHWYLLSRNLSFSYLIRITKLLLAALGIRTFLLIAVLLLLSHAGSVYSQQYIARCFSLEGDLLFFLMRVLWGLALPLVLAFMAWRCAVGKANQAATGLLYLCEVSVLFGELFAAYLMV